MPDQSLQCPRSLTWVGTLSSWGPDCGTQFHIYHSHECPMPEWSREQMRSVKWTSKIRSHLFSSLSHLLTIIVLSTCTKMKTKRKQNVKHISHFFHNLLLWFAHTEKLWKQYVIPDQRNLDRNIVLWYRSCKHNVMKYGSVLSPLQKSVCIQHPFFRGFVSNCAIPILLNFYVFHVDDDYNFLMGKVLLGLEQWLCSSLLLSQGLCLMNVSVCRCK